MLLSKPKKNQAGKGAIRLLISITVMGSAGPIRFVVSEDERVAAVIDTTLKSYAREGRLPALGLNFDNFVLYSPNASTEAFNPEDTIGSLGVRNFVLCKKQPQEKLSDDRKQAAMARKSGSSWKTWFNKSLNSKIVSL